MLFPLFREELLVFGRPSRGQETEVYQESPTSYQKVLRLKQGKMVSLQKNVCFSGEGLTSFVDLFPQPEKTEVLGGNHPETCFARYGGAALKAGYVS